jgi:hypothetical protein
LGMAFREDDSTGKLWIMNLHNSEY